MADIAIRGRDIIIKDTLSADITLIANSGVVSLKSLGSSNVLTI